MNYSLLFRNLTVKTLNSFSPVIVTSISYKLTNGYITRIFIWCLGIFSTQRCGRINSLPLEYIHYSLCIMYIPEHLIIRNTTIVRVETCNLCGLMVDEQLSRAAHTDGVANKTATYHDDCIKWKHSPRYWPCVGEFIGHRCIPHTKPITRSFDVFFDLHLN